MNINNKFMNLSLPKNIKKIYSGEVERLFSNKGSTVDERILDCYNDYQKKNYSEQWCKRVFDLINDITSMDKEVIKFIEHLSKYQEMKIIVDDVSNAFKYASSLAELINEYDQKARRIIDSYSANAYKCYFDLNSSMTRFYDIKNFYQHICLIDSQFSTKFLNYLDNTAKANRENIAKYKSTIVDFLNNSDKYFNGISLSMEINNLMSSNKSLLDNVYNLNLSSSDKFYNYLKTNPNVTTNLLNIFNQVDPLNQKNIYISDTCKDQTAISNLKALNNYRDTLLPLLRQKDNALCELSIKDLLNNYRKKYQSKVNDYLQSLTCSQKKLMEEVYRDEKPFVTCLDKIKEIIDYGEKNKTLLTNVEIKNTIQSLKNDYNKLNDAYKNKTDYFSAFNLDKEIMAFTNDPTISKLMYQISQIHNEYNRNPSYYYAGNKNLSGMLDLDNVERKANNIYSKITVNNMDYMEKKHILDDFITEIKFIREVDRLVQYYSLISHYSKNSDINSFYTKYNKLNDELRKNPFVRLKFPLSAQWKSLGETIYKDRSAKLKAAKAKEKRDKFFHTLLNIIIFPFKAIWLGFKYLGIGIFNLFKLIGRGFAALFEAIGDGIKAILRGIGNLFTNRGVLMLILAIIPVAITILTIFGSKKVPGGKANYVILGIFNVIISIVTIIGAFKNSDEDDNKIGHIILSVLLILLPITMLALSKELRLNVYIDLFVGVGMIIVAGCAMKDQYNVTPSSYNVFTFSTLAFIVGTVIFNAIMHSLTRSVVLYVFYYIILTAIMFAILVSAFVSADADFDEITGTIVFFSGAVIISLAFLCFALTTKSASYLWGAIPGVIIGLVVALWGFVLECDQ